MRLRLLFCTPFLAACALSVDLVAQTASPGATGSGNGTFTAPTSYAGVALEGLDFGAGVVIPGDTSATGNFHASLEGPGRLITIDCRVSGGSILADGSATFEPAAGRRAGVQSSQRSR